ncbi:glycosyltransferase family 4 protein [Motilibacter aurantiacus]|uniref:glycosyltransferase family 4 protein n=1 Tax=Motilibacter aurantiacus TaxID=2714955 RepID=UPI00140D44BA|nr:glycosyltransferase family 4 protein [Motilibacter aurantiacus]
MSGTSPLVVHAVRSDAFAGVERYISSVAPRILRAGWRVQVLGGDPGRMPAELGPGIGYSPAASTGQLVPRLLRVARGADIVHVHMTAAELAGALTKPATRARLVTTRHFAARRGASLPGRLAAVGIRAALDAQIAISRYAAEESGEDAVVIHSGVPDAQASTDRERRVLMLQRHEAEKHTDEGLRAWARSGLGAEGWRLALAGDGSLRPSLEKLAGELGVADSVDFLGHVHDPHPLLAGSAILLATTRIEGFGLSVAEAMAHGCAVVATDSGAHRETVARRDCLYAPGDVDACAALLRALAGDDAARRRVGDELRERQRAEFSLDRHADRLLTFYGELLSIPKGRR